MLGELQTRTPRWLAKHRFMSIVTRNITAEADVELPRRVCRHALLFPLKVCRVIQLRTSRPLVVRPGGDRRHSQRSPGARKRVASRRAQRGLRPCAEAAAPGPRPRRGAMASANNQFSSHEDFRRAKELEEARKAGLAPAALDEEGKEINPHIPQYMASAPWYLNSDHPSLKHQKDWRQHADDDMSMGYDRGKKVFQAAKYRKGACQKCALRGARQHSQPQPSSCVVTATSCPRCVERADRRAGGLDLHTHRKLYRHPTHRRCL